MRKFRLHFSLLLAPDLSPMKKLFFILLSLLVVFILLAIGVYAYVMSTKPVYSGNIHLKDIQDSVDVHFDDYGIPHIYAQNKTDLYTAFGYVHAQERLFQMEMMRRVGSGRLSEIYGKDLLEVDKIFRTIVNRVAIDRDVSHLNTLKNFEVYENVEAYLRGINQFIDEGSTPLEYSIIGIPKEHFVKKDLLYIAAYMAYSFAIGQRTDPLVEHIHKNHGYKYLQNFGLEHQPGLDYNPTYHESESLDISSFSSYIQEELNKLPVPQFIGSNAWVVSGELTESGKPMLCNDTHIKYAQPQVWYEAHLNCPDFEIYGNFLAGIPFAMVGHNQSISWGVTMLEHDDMDFFWEELNGDSTEYFRDNTTIPTHRRYERIKIKGDKDTLMTVIDTHHGPLVNNLYPALSTKAPITCRWDYIFHKNHLMEAFYEINNAQDIKTTENAVAKIHGPGLNVVYADTAGNIAWWTAAKFMKRPFWQNSKLVIDGTDADNDHTGYYEFSENPSAVNPPSNFIVTANDQPGPIDSLFYPGYYKPEHRALRIKELLQQDSSWNIESMKKVITDVTCPTDADISNYLYNQLQDENLNTHEKEALELLIWDGSHELESLSPTLFYKLLYHILEKATADEFGPDNFEGFLSTHWMKKAYIPLIKNENSIWWDNINTEVVESRSEVLLTAFQQSVDDLDNELGPVIDNWIWGNVHTLEIPHPLGNVAALRPYFSIEKSNIRGGHETINQAGFTLNSSGIYQTIVGSQMRIIINMSNPQTSVSITPSGQSGNILSPYYKDQANLYNTGGFRSQEMRLQIIQKSGNHLFIIPSDK